MHNKPHTIESRLKMSISLKGKTAWNKGMKMSNEFRNKMSKIYLGKPKPWLVGKKLSEEHKLKLRLAKVGKNLKPEHKIKISQALLGKKRKPFTEEQKRNLSLSHIGKMTGSDNPSWKGGVKPLMLQIRHSWKYKLWRSDIFERDKFTCQECDISGCELNADHIKSFSQIIQENKIKTLEQALECEELWDIDNGRTLCVSCHRKTDTFGYRGKQVFNELTQ